ncbi:hypothetical protein LPV64_08320, partial [Ralstonia pseudosolanacearum]|nr:hypothetical protein [Ralstonia pseudosolanacearum]
VIVLYDGKLGNGKSLSGLFQLTEVVMVDVQDSFTMKLDQAALFRRRRMLLGVLDGIDVCMRSKAFVGAVVLEERAAELIDRLGGLASPW